MTGEAPTGGTVALEDAPLPTIAVDIVDGTPRIAGVNEPFRSRFGDVTVDSRLHDALTAAGFDVDDGALTPARLESGLRQSIRRTNEDESSSGAGDSHVLLSIPVSEGGALVVLLADVWAGPGPGPGRGESDARTDATAVANGEDRGKADPTTEQSLAAFASAIGHDLRNPLDVAKARLRAGRERADDEHFEHVERALDRLDRRIDDVVALADTGAADRTESIDVGAVAERAWADCRTGRARLAVRGPFPAVEADESGVRRIFENLFRNAVEHGSTSLHSAHPREDAVEHGSTSPRSKSSREDAADHGLPPEAGGEKHPGARVADDGSPAELTVTVDRLTDPDGFSVEDDGSGIPEDIRDRLFDPGVSGEEHGTGLGLAIVDRIADRHGWTVAATTGDDGGARFEIVGVDFDADDTLSESDAR
ncbi:HTR-like protein [Salinarchaeum sp. Harcht-Bsk1]|uniref:sensor histidine kinase n=1 Tax=Salinarchaeum sp. Harcht-Bsk1 TaxID=1333523 RepID=UPI0003424497|nr:HAMP domain-containing sensor histidine kinase [Salinarchaeum sp. Harcht-Bsk1]AGN00858.1 HTR-like protein [Salinarchaeum sp. Harcht-Bsk1]